MSERKHITEDEIEALEKALDGVTLGPWEYDNAIGNIYCDTEIGEFVAADMTESIGSFIAAFDPPTVRRLLDEIKALRMERNAPPAYGEIVAILDWDE